MGKPLKVDPVVKDGLRRAAVAGGIRQPDMAKLVAHFFDEAGGEKAVARMLFREFQNAGEGSVVRQRILDMILRATGLVNARNPVEEDLGILSDVDLDREFESLVTAAAAASASGKGASEHHGVQEEAPGRSGGAAASEPTQGGASAAQAVGAADRRQGRDPEDPEGGGVRTPRFRE